MLALTAQAMVVVSRRRETTARAAATITMMMKLDKTGLGGAAGGTQNEVLIISRDIMHV